MSDVRRAAAEGLPSRRDPVQGVGLLPHGLAQGLRCGQVRDEGRRGRIVVHVLVAILPDLIRLVGVVLDVGLVLVDDVGVALIVLIVLGLFWLDLGLERVGLLSEQGAGGGRPSIGIIGGSGFYSLLEGASETVVDTPYGRPSGPVTVGDVRGRRVAFLPRHGVKHELPPHRVPYRANLWALKELGVERVLGPCAVGSLRADVRPGDFVVCDQLVDRTSGRALTFYDGPVTTHISFADPYCPQVRPLLVERGRAAGLSIRDGGTVVVIEGPRFSTRSESKAYASAGWEVINMTQVPEAQLARELELCYANVSLVTDYDVGVEGETEAVSHEEVIRVFTENLGRLRDLLFDVVGAIPADRTCGCGSALANARFEV